MPSQGTQVPNTSTPQPKNVGSWARNSDGTWTWNANTAPDPNLVKQWGHDALTDIKEDPTGKRNKGAWHMYGHGPMWVWGSDPNPNDERSYTHQELTDPDHLPNSADHGSTNVNKVPPPDVVAPTLTDSWGGVAPDVNGQNLVGSDSGSAQQLTEPPAHAQYLVSPGSIRDTESVVLLNIDLNLRDYDSLKTAVADALHQNVYMANMIGDLVHNQDRLLLQIGDAIELAGQYTRALNNAAQLYAKADIDSFFVGPAVYVLGTWTKDA